MSASCLILFNARRPTSYFVTSDEKDVPVQISLTVSVFADRERLVRIAVGGSLFNWVIIESQGVGEGG